MELNIEVFNKLCSFIDDAKKNINYEFEVRFWNKNNIKINSEKYNKIFHKFTFSKDNNGLGYKYEMKNILDIILDKDLSYNSDNIRISINGLDNIKKYWLTSNMNDIDVSDVKFIEKEKIDKIDDENYNIRFSLNNEIPETELLNKNKDLLLSSTQDKIFRLKNRYSIFTDDNLFLIDMTSIKYGSGKSFKESTTLKENYTYEIEIEYIGKNIDVKLDFVAKKLLYYCEIILKILQNTDILITNTLTNNIKNFYNKLVYNKYNDNFIAASPVTIHRDNLLKSSNTNNIYNKYAVTLKADGERNFLIVYHSSNKEDNGKIFIFNNNFHFIYTGYKDTEWCNTLIEAELIDNSEIYMYDILFSKGEDVRRKHLTDIRKETISNTRLDILDKFQKSTSRKIHENFNDKNCIKIKTKKYIQSVRNDGSDIFQKVKELWDNRKYSTFNVDGIIFVPKYEYYPLHGGSWKSLFKWKPPELNTIDFLIKVAKDDSKKDIKSPYIDIIDRLDGKSETILKQFKTIQLYVTGQKTVYTENHKANKKNIPIPFNPFNLDEKNSEIYNMVKIIIDDSEKIYANDPITGEKEEIYDDIIVEFGYDNSKEDGFKWIPYRFRKDKTMLYKNGKEMFGNSQYTANDVFKAINLPVSEEMITTGNIPLEEVKGDVDKKSYYLRDLNDNSKRERFQYQNFHNHYVKYQLLYFSSPSYIHEYTSGTHGKLLDLCCGKGVDINKIKRAKYTEVVGMDIDYKNIKEAQEFYKNMVPFPKPKAFYFRGDSSKLIWPVQSCGDTEMEKMKAKEYIPTKYLFDTVSLQFCFHYFFKDEISLRTIIQNINDNLKIGGFVIGTTFDGERIYNQLKNNEFISGKTSSGELMWKVDKKFSSTKLLFSEKKPNFGKQIDVFVKTIGVVHPEYLVNFNYLDKIMEEYGFSKVVLKPFEEFYNELIEGKNVMDLTDFELKKDIDVVKKMSEDEKRFSFMSSAFIYKKEKNSSDSLFKKLVDLVEKKHKLKKKDGVYKVDEDTEHIIEDSEE